MVMRKHQRYFPVYSSDGQLLPKFIAVANGPVNAALVKAGEPSIPACNICHIGRSMTLRYPAGNEAVLRARFEDALFFYESDIKKPLREYVPALSGILFQQQLGTMLQKTERVQQLIPHLAAAMGMSGRPS